MNWKQSLDKYLTTPPDDGFDGWAESVINAVSDDVYTENEKWFESDECDEYLNELFRQDLDVQLAAAEIESFLKFH